MKLRYITLILLSTLLSGCAYIDDTALRLKILGDYTSDLREVYDDGIACDVTMCIDEDFSFFGLFNQADMLLAFRLQDAFEFSDLTLHYKLSVLGDWIVRDSLITVEVDTSTFECTFIASDAQAYTEQTMVRYLRKYVRETFIPSMQRRLANQWNRTVRFSEVNDEWLLVLSLDGTQSIVMKRRRDEP